MLRGWRERIERGAAAAGLDLRFGAPVTDHAASDAAGTAIFREHVATVAAVRELAGFLWAAATAP